MTSLSYRDLTKAQRVEVDRALDEPGVYAVQMLSTPGGPLMVKVLAAQRLLQEDPKPKPVRPPQPLPLAEAIARAQASADEQLRGRIARYLGQAGMTPRRGLMPRGKFCEHCRDAPRYPDFRCAEHTAWLPEGGADARARDSNPVLWLQY